MGSMTLTGGAILLLIACILLLLRFAGEKAFKVIPETVPPQDVSPDTTLYKAVASRLANDGSTADSYYFPVSDARTALFSRLRMIESAEQSIDAQYYALHDDDAGHAVLAYLIEAADRGVKVRLLLDDMDTQGRDKVYARLSAENPNLEIRIFNPNYVRAIRVLDYLARFPRSSRRMHNKSLSVDGIGTIVGGRNIGNEYFDVNAKFAFSDFDVIAAGQIVSAVVEEFDTYWYSGIAFDTARLSKPENDGDYAAWMAKLITAKMIFREEISINKELVPELLVENDWEIYSGPGQVICDRPEKVLGNLFDTNGNLATTIIELMSSAQKELLISSPYFIPGKEGMEVFRKLRERGIKVIVLTNSFAANDVVVVHAGYIDYRKKLVEMGVEMYEFRREKAAPRNKAFLGASRASLHAKTFVIDHSRAYIGSFNLDSRSAIHNTEMGIVFENDKFGQHVAQYQESVLDQSSYKLRLADSGKLEWIEFKKDGGTVVHAKEPNTNFLIRTMVYLLSWLPVEWLM